MPATIVPQPAIRVVTHNGLMPDQGGLRVGYQVGTTFIGSGSNYVPIDQMIAALNRPAPIVVPKIIYAHLPQTTGRTCPTCKEWIPPSVQSTETDTDEGKKNVLICPYCKVKFVHLTTLHRSQYDRY